MDQPGKVANPARGQLNREKCFFPVPVRALRIWSRETGSAVPSRVSPLILHTQAKSDSLICMYSHHREQSMDQPGSVANPARSQLNRENVIFPCPSSSLRIWSRETGSAVPSRVSLLISILRRDLVHTHRIPPDFRVYVLRIAICI